jgi:hypothetical protein
MERRESKNRSRTKEQKALAAKAASEAIERTKKSVTASRYEKGYSEVIYEDDITSKFAIQNKCEKAIRAI